jgi:hypothetical protein
MQETWDVSALIDKGTRIHDARGMTMHHLGMGLRHFADHAFIDFVTPGQRAWFRRCIAQTTAGGEMGIVTADLETGAVAPQPFFVTARPAKAADRWWLMVTASLPDELKTAARAPSKPSLASGHEFMLLVESAAQQAGDRLDLMRVNAPILGDENAASAETRAELQAQFDEIVLGNAYDGIASRTGTGEYLLLRERDSSSDSLFDQLGAAAESRSISREQLGLESNSMQLSALGDNPTPAGLRRAFDTLRHADGDAPQWEGVEMRQPFYLRPVVWAAAIVVIAAAGWLIA